MPNRLRKVNWPVVAVATALLVIVALFGHYLGNRQRIADARAERQRQAICAILANIRSAVPAEIETARRAFARDGHPRDCRPIIRVRPSPTPAPAVTPTVVVVPMPGSTSTAAPAPAPAVTVTRPPPRPSRSPMSRPTPTPSPTCVAVLCLR